MKIHRSPFLRLLKRLGKDIAKTLCGFQGKLFIDLKVLGSSLGAPEFSQHLTSVDKG
jgi:hypothetical protein